MSLFDVDDNDAVVESVVLVSNLDDDIDDVVAFIDARRSDDDDVFRSPPSLVLIL